MAINDSIWHTNNDVPVVDDEGYANVIFQLDEDGIFLGGAWNGSKFEELMDTVFDKKDIRKWAYIKDLVECQANQTDKIQKLEAKLKLATDFLKVIADYPNAVDNPTTREACIALETIKFLESKR